MRRILAGILVIATLAFSITYYLNFRTLNVTELNDHSAKYDGRVVRVEGTVSQNAGILGSGGYVITDNKSSIIVLSDDGIPENGSHVVVSGLFKKAISLNSLEYNTILADSFK